MRTLFIRRPPSQLARLYSSRTVTDNARMVRVSALNVPMIPEAMRTALFGASTAEKYADLNVKLNKAKDHLEHHKLNLSAEVPKQAEELFAKTKLPKLLGRNIEEHFENVGRELARPYKAHATHLAEIDLPPMPRKWQTRRGGWMRYDTEHPLGQPVEYPHEEALVFDVEVCIANGNKHPTLAVAASERAWYSWASPGLSKARATDDLISMGPVARLVVGHNVSYDRARVAEEYRLQRSDCAYLDTMSMHICINGMTSGQRNTWRKYRKEDMDNAPDWVEMTAMNSLADLSRLYCKTELSKEDRNVFVEGALTDVRANAQQLFQYCARDVAATHAVYKVLGQLWFKSFGDVTFAGMIEMGSAYLPVTPAWDEFIRTTDSLYHHKMNEIQAAMARLAGQALDDVTSGRVDKAADPWLSQLDWSLPKGKLRGKDAAHLQDKPKWYRDAYKDGALSITTRSRTAPCLLRLRWQGRPVVFDTEIHSWGYVDGTTGAFAKLPHADGDDKSVGSPLAKGFLKDIDGGTLTSEYSEARAALQTAAECSYWVSTHDRVKQQLVHVDKAHGWPAIVPLLISAGTVTRRAVEATWLTASNAKKDRLGSELKAQVQAPPGYKFVGADVDSQELWIAAVIGDAAFCGLHGSTAMGWMALRGTKNQGTDVHSRTADLVGIDRNTAKIFNYGRIYGAGIKFAEKLLQQHNRGMTAAEAAERAARLYENTKGTRWYHLDPRTASRITSERPDLYLDDCWASRSTLESFYGNRLPWGRMARWECEWRGGTESHMFNALERIANSASPATPVLGSPLSPVVRKDVAENGYLTSRVNWVVQSSAVDYLHLMLVSMRHLCTTYKIDARFSISIHDEVRYLVRDEDADRAALALHYTNLFVRAMFAARLRMPDLPTAVAFFEAVDIDTVLRKEVHMDCVTPSQPQPIPHGRAVDMYTCYVTNKTRLATPRTAALKPPTLSSGWGKFAVTAAEVEAALSAEATAVGPGRQVVIAVASKHKAINRAQGGWQRAE